MTIEGTKKAIEVMQAFVDGKKIEYWDGDGWNEIKDPVWAWADGCDGFNYRIKPEPHYRPFESAGEVMEAIKEHGDWVRTKSNIYYILKSFHYTGDNGYFFTDTHGNVSQGSMLADYVFADGTPFGVKEE